MSVESVGWLDVEEVARLLDLKPKTVYLLAGEKCPAERRIPSYRFGMRGGKLRFHPDDIRAYIESRKATVKASPAALKHLRPREVVPRLRHA